jgi:thioredoxin 1
MRGSVNRLLRWVAAATLMLCLLACGGEGERSAQGGPQNQRLPLKPIENQAAFNRVIASAGDRLLLFDVYADWCSPCKELEPLLESIAWRNRRNVDFYKINLDENQFLFDLFQVRGIPLVVFVRKQTVVYSLMGLRPKEAYQEAIRSFSRE